jgi:hypothetical protein
METLLNIYYLGIKELRSLSRDTMMLVMIIFSFTGQVYLIATGVPQSLHKRQSPSSTRTARHSPPASSTPFTNRIF